MIVKEATIVVIDSQVVVDTKNYLCFSSEKPIEIKKETVRILRKKEPHEKKYQIAEKLLEIPQVERIVFFKGMTVQGKNPSTFIEEIKDIVTDFFEEVRFAHN